MKVKTSEHHNRAAIVKIADGQYEVIGATPEELIAAKQWASFWGHKIVSRENCHRQRRRLRIPPAFRFLRAFRLCR
ncbi:MAG TPA: hypothetical protein VGY98_10210 [Verrucomicrobiae bacterium]|nr:hypothetical protein [Verrucomicrobiae bacterium]